MYAERFIYYRYILKLLLIIVFFATLTVIIFTFYAHLYLTSAQHNEDEGKDGGLVIPQKPNSRGGGVFKFRRRPETAHVQCDRILHGDLEYVEKIAKNRTTLISRDIDMDCGAVRSRILPPKRMKPLHPFGVAYARIVYESYEFIEDELRSSYHPQNFFCYSVDSKADDEFNERIETLQECLPNVFVTKARFDINRFGQFMNHAYYECFKLLAPQQGWGYLILMQNYDIMTKSVYETAAILDRLGGANDVHIRPCEDNRWNHTAKWDARSLKLFRDEARTDPEKLNATLTMARGAVHASLSRAAVDWMVNTVDLTKLLDQLNINVLGVDEVLLPTLQVSEALDMPGRFTANCMKKRQITGFITRMEIWQYEHSELCFSKKFRHCVCIFGIEDFPWLSNQLKLLANKMMPSFDYAAVDCMHELLFNRTHLGQINHELQLALYESQPYVSVQALMMFFRGIPSFLTVMV
ncbi:hypothetical protein Y032_0083g1681 [Ancylostoma ceylanicum]|uniref:Core-2/I-Branching enzyme n=2 Tax=Ancylostoma ceylanicum TaxID=53326 RepID=A0A016TRL1_9BILA|nr:hypothetical protein Y032_0083g1681 [Ancylostoma ceylanicum]